MPKIGYNISKIENTLSKIDISASSSNCNELEKELNDFFTEARCAEVIYTKNTDKLFFGMCVMPNISDREVGEILLTDKDKRVNKYALELDSKLFEIGLSERELTAAVLHEIGHLVTNDLPIKEVRKKVDLYLAQNKEEFDVEDTISTNSHILAYGIKDTLTKVGSIFNKDDYETIADSFVVLCGYGEDLESALNKLTSSTKSLTIGIKGPKLIIWDWCFRLYKNIKVKRISAIHTLNSAKAISPSTLQKKEMNSIIQFLRDDAVSVMKESETLLNEAKEKLGFVNSLKYGNIRVLEDDLFELTLRAKSANDEDSALYIMRQINTRMSILKDYISIKDISDSDREYWTAVWDKYYQLRETLSNKKMWDRKNYGLFFDYNALDNGEDPYHGQKM